MRTVQTRLTLDAAPREIKEITIEIWNWVERQRVGCGLVSVYIPHTSASLLIQENASPEVRQDLEVFFCRPSPKTARFTATTTRRRTTCRPV